MAPRLPGLPEEVDGPEKVAVMLTIVVADGNFSHASFRVPFMKRGAGWFEGQEALLVYIAASLGDATRLEAILEAAGLDFGVEADEYEGGFLFRTTRTGAFFYVLEADLEVARRIMREHGFRPSA
jgi:hypothetical protein